MQASVLVELAQRALLIALYVALPILGASAAVGLAVSAVQAAFRQSDATAMVAPRLLASGAVLLIFGGWMLAMLGGFWTDLWSCIPQMVR